MTCYRALMARTADGPRPAPLAHLAVSRRPARVPSWSGRRRAFRALAEPVGNVVGVRTEFDRKPARCQNHSGYCRTFAEGQSWFNGRKLVASSLKRWLEFIINFLPKEFIFISYKKMLKKNYKRCNEVICKVLQMSLFGSKSYLVGNFAPV